MIEKERWNPGDVIMCDDFNGVIVFVLLAYKSHHYGVFLSSQFGIDVRSIDKDMWPNSELA